MYEDMFYKNARSTESVAGNTDLQSDVCLLFSPFTLTGCIVSNCSPVYDWFEVLKFLAKFEEFILPGYSINLAQIWPLISSTPEAQKHVSERLFSFSFLKYDTFRTTL